MFSFAHAALYGIGAYGPASRRDGDTPHHRCATRRRRRRNPQHPDCAPGASLVRGIRRNGHTGVRGDRLPAGDRLPRSHWWPDRLHRVSILFGGNRIALYYFVFALVAALLVVQYGLLVNRFGLVARAIREAPDAARMLGTTSRDTKLTGFIIGSAIAGVAGGLQAHTVLIISPPMIEVNRMIEFMAMGIIGGLRTIGGGIFRSRDRLRTLRGTS